MSLTAPFPWFGGKRRWADRIWQKLGNPTAYAEPFAGSLAVLLHKKIPCQREVVGDTDGGISNFWRAMQNAPDEVAYWAEYPTIHQDLTARHLWLKNWFIENYQKLSEDPHFYDAKVAGWWVWGVSLWIGGGWCHVESDRMPTLSGAGKGGRGVSQQVKHYDKIPRIKAGKGGDGVSQQRTAINDQIPHVSHCGAGSGVSAQRRDQIPRISDCGVGQGVSAQRAELKKDDQMPMVQPSGGGRGVCLQTIHRPHLLDWFHRLQERLRSVIVLNRSWESALTPTVLMQTDTMKRRGGVVTGIFLDPPYLTSDRVATLYASDLDNESDAVAVKSFKWAIEHGEEYRIAYACHDGDFDVPDGWIKETKSFKGPNTQRGKQDCVMFSPACNTNETKDQIGMFDDV